MKQPSRSKTELRSFGLTLAAAFAIVAGCLPPALFGRAWHFWPFALAFLLSLWALLAPASMQALYRLWMKLGLAINKVTSPLLLGLVFYLLLTPIGLLMRSIKGDPLRRTLEPRLETYRIIPGENSHDDMETPF